jgi:hypothetical protein
MENLVIGFILGAFVMFWSYGHALELIYRVLKKKNLI